MTPVLVALVALVVLGGVSGRMSRARMDWLVGLGISVLAVRLALTGELLGGAALGVVAAVLMGARVAGAGAAARARALLGVGADADARAVRAAYRARAAVAHPDRGGDPEAMKALSAARDLLLRGRGGSAKRSR